ncbi:helix-turn-helix domain-containing protein [Streptomyces sp. NPDC002564]|uniref:helix-turn-helix domain-containing protein n=1 Tax=Streptomyces sp. NPDC002564 TaxID=3364649 RepID=UPI00368586BA
MEDAEATEALARLRRRLRERQGTEGLTTTRLSRKVGLGRTTVSNALNDGNGRPSWNTVATIARALRLGADEITELHRLWERAAPAGEAPSRRPAEPSRATTAAVEPESSSPAPASGSGRRRARGAVVLGIAVLAAVGGGLAKWQPWTDEEPPGAGDRVTSKGRGEEVKATTTAPVKVVSVSPQDTGANSWAFQDARSFGPSELKSVNASSLTDETHRWFTSRGAVPVDRRLDLITLQGNTSQPVEINDLQVDKECRAPLSGTLFESPNAGQDSNVRLTLDLDEQLPTAKSVEKDGTSSPSYFSRHTISLERGERQKILVDAATAKHYCAYTLVLRMTVGDETVTQVVKDDGKPFQLSAHVSQDEDIEVSGYRSAYVGGVLNTCGGGAFRQVDPETWTSLDTQC